jgi:hypothetical protein
VDALGIFTELVTEVLIMAGTIFTDKALEIDILTTSTDQEIITAITAVVIIAAAVMEGAATEVVVTAVAVMAGVVTEVGATAAGMEAATTSDRNHPRENGSAFRFNSRVTKTRGALQAQSGAQTWNAFRDRRNVTGKSLADSAQSGEGNVTLAALDSPQIIPVQVAFSGKIFLSIP